MKHLLIFFLLTPFVVIGQDIHFSQMNLSPLTLNPALVGANYDLEANLNYRSQWNSVNSPFQTIGASVYSRLNPENKPTKKAYIAAGIDFFNDQAGLTNRVVSNNVNLHFATHLIVGKGSTLGLGLYGGWAQRSIDPSGSTWASQYDGSAYNSLISSGEDFNRASFGVFDVGTGIVYTYNSGNSRIGINDAKKINVGFAAYHLSRPNYSFLASEERQYIRFSGFVNGSFGVQNTRLIVEPGIYFNQQGPAREIFLGTYFKYIIIEESHYTIFVQPFTASLGVFYRNKDALVVKAMLEWNGIGLGFAYDVNTFNTLMTASKGKGAFEFALRYVVPDFSRRPYVSGGRSFF